MAANPEQTVNSRTACPGFAAIALMGMGTILSQEWRRSKCAYVTFETAHFKLIGRESPFSPRFSKYWPKVQTRETGEWVEAVGYCDEMVEKVRLPKLEAAVW